MFYQASEHIAKKLVEKNTISSENKPIYQYGIQQGFTIGLNILTTFVIGLVFKMIVESFLFLAVYIPLRSFAGGVHAKTANRCYVYSTIMIIAELLVIKFFPFGIFIGSCLSLISGAIIFLLAPVETENKKLDESEKQVYKKRARIILIIELVIQFIIALMSWNNIMMCFSLAFVSLSLVMLAGVIKNNHNDKQNKINSVYHCLLVW